jgi:hypothetical protein
LRRVVLRADLNGDIDSDAARRACDPIRPGDDVVVVIRGRVGPEPGVAGLVGRALAEARTVEVTGSGPWVATFARWLHEAAQREAASA